MGIVSSIPQINSKLKFVTSFLHNPKLKENKTILAIWLVTAAITVIAKLIIGKFNNYKIFEGVYNHAIHGLTLYGPYPEEYGDVNLYGIIFSFIISPFAILPQWLGMVLWVMANTALLFYAIQQLPLSKNQKAIICWTAYIELITAQLVQQFNISVAAFILLAFAFIEKKKDFWAAFVILLGTFVKIYSIVGLAFFFFSKHKIKLLLSCLFWTILLFIFPIPFFGLEYTISQYQDWFIAITEKNSHNMFAISQNVSLLGLVRRVSGNPDYSDLWLIVPGLILFFIPYLRIRQYKSLSFRFLLLANVLLFTVLFSSGSEASSYVTAMLGVGIWYVNSPASNKKLNYWLLILTIIVVAISTTELTPPFFRRAIVHPYVVKSWFCILVWLKICYEMIFLTFDQKSLNHD